MDQISNTDANNAGIVRILPNNVNVEVSQSNVTQNFNRNEVQTRGFINFCIF